MSLHVHALINVVSVCLLPLLLSVDSPLRGAAVTKATWPGADGTGHELHVAGDCPSNVAFGTTTQCEILAAGETDIYTFTASENNTIKVKLARTSGNLDPSIRIYSSTGKNICSAFSSDTIVDIGACTMPSSGTYTLEVNDTFSNNVGQYNLFVQNLSAPESAPTIQDRQSFVGSIRLVGQVSTYSFSAAANDQVTVRMTRTSDDLRPRIRIYGADGTVVCSEFTSSARAEISDCRLPNSGMYTVLVDDTGSRLGNYILYLEYINRSAPPFTSSTYLPLITQPR